MIISTRASSRVGVLCDLAECGFELRLGGLLVHQGGDLRVRTRGLQQAVDVTGPALEPLIVFGFAAESGDGDVVSGGLKGQAPASSATSTALI